MNFSDGTNQEINSALSQYFEARDYCTDPQIMTAFMVKYDISIVKDATLPCWHAFFRMAKSNGNFHPAKGVKLPFGIDECPIRAVMKCVIQVMDMLHAKK